MNHLQQANYNDHRDDEAAGDLNPAQLHKTRDPNIDHELLGFITNRPGIERRRTIEEQIAFEAEGDAFAKKMGWEA